MAAVCRRFQSTVRAPLLPLYGSSVARPTSHVGPSRGTQSEKKVPPIHAMQSPNQGTAPRRQEPFTLFPTKPAQNQRTTSGPSGSTPQPLHVTHYIPTGLRIAFTRSRHSVATDTCTSLKPSVSATPRIQERESHRDFERRATTLGRFNDATAQH